MGISMPKDMQEKMDNTVHVEVDLRDLPKDKAAKIKEVVKRDRAEGEKQMKKESAKYEERHARRAKAILGLLTDGGVPTEKDASKKQDDKAKSEGKKA